MKACHTACMMDARFIDALDSRREEIRYRWEVLLRIERVVSPLGDPDTLVYLIDFTLNQILQALREGASRPVPQDALRSCDCHHNPFLGYFRAGRQALMEGLILAQARLAPLDAASRDGSLAQLRDTVEALAHREITTFCSLCERQQRSVAPCAALNAGH